ncbi:hypothetical protein BJ944DRAFT_237884 [Cunninghamella echinulata]|nr:hypothetical protein BJ944DRAFT_237884 [Cunninghamella echinulata]
MAVTLCSLVTYARARNANENQTLLCKDFCESGAYRCRIGHAFSQIYRWAQCEQNVNYDLRISRGCSDSEWTICEKLKAEVTGTDMVICTCNIDTKTIESAQLIIGSAENYCIKNGTSFDFEYCRRYD